MSFTRQVLRAAERKEKRLRAKFYGQAAKELQAEGKLTPDTPLDVAQRLVGTRGEALKREAADV